MQWCRVVERAVQWCSVVHCGVVLCTEVQCGAVVPSVDSACSGVVLCSAVQWSGSCSGAMERCVQW
jgi:hypothetical protein